MDTFVIMCTHVIWCEILSYYLVFIWSITLCSAMAKKNCQCYFRLGSVTKCLAGFYHAILIKTIQAKPSCAPRVRHGGHRRAWGAARDVRLPAFPVCPKLQEAKKLARRTFPFCLSLSGVPLSKRISRTRKSRSEANRDWSWAQGAKWRDSSGGRHWKGTSKCLQVRKDPSMQGKTGSGKSTRVVEFLLTLMDKRPSLPGNSSQWLAPIGSRQWPWHKKPTPMQKNGQTASRRVLVERTEYLQDPPRPQVRLLCRGLTSQQVSEGSAYVSMRLVGFGRSQLTHVLQLPALPHHQSQ